MTNKKTHKIKNGLMVMGVSATTLLTPLNAMNANASTTNVHFTKQTAVVYNAKNHVIGSIKKNTPVKVLSSNQAKSYIQYGKHKGYVFSKYIGYETKVKNVYTLTVKNKDTALKQKASAKSKTLIKLGQNTKVTLAQSKTNSKWIKVTSHKLTGYVAASDLKIKKSTKPANPAVTNSYTAKPITSATNSSIKATQAKLTSMTAHMVQIKKTKAPSIAKSATSAENSKAKSEALSQLSEQKAALTSAQSSVNVIIKSTADSATKSIASVAQSSLASQIKINSVTTKSVAKTDDLATQQNSAAYQSVVAESVGISAANLAKSAASTISSANIVAQSAAAKSAIASTNGDSSANKNASKLVSSAEKTAESASQVKDSANSQVDLSYRDAFTDENQSSTDSLNTLMATVLSTSANASSNSTSSAKSTSDSSNTKSSASSNTKDTSVEAPTAAVIPSTPAIPTEADDDSTNNTATTKTVLAEPTYSIGDNQGNVINGVTTETQSSAQSALASMEASQAQVKSASAADTKVYIIKNTSTNQSLTGVTDQTLSSAYSQLGLTGASDKNASTTATTKEAFSSMATGVKSVDAQSYYSGISSYDSDTASKAAIDNTIYTNDSQVNSAISSANTAMLNSLAALHGGQPTTTQSGSNTIYLYPDGTVQALTIDPTASSSTADNSNLHSMMASAANSNALQSMSSLHGQYVVKSQPDQTTYIFADGYTYERENDLDWFNNSKAVSNNAIEVVASGSKASLSAVATSDTSTDSPVYEQAMINAHGSEYTVTIGNIVYQSYADGTKVATYDNRAGVQHSSESDSANFAGYSVASDSSNASSASSNDNSGATSSNNSINPTPSGISSDQLASLQAQSLAALASAQAKNGVANPYVKKYAETNSNTMGSNGLYDSAGVNKLYNSMTDEATQVNLDTSTADKTDHNQADYAVSAHSASSNADANSAHSQNPNEIDSSGSTSMASSEVVFINSEMAAMHSNSVAIDSTQVSINSVTSSAASSYQAVQNTANSYNHDLASATDNLNDVRRQYEIADSTAFSYAMDAQKASNSNESAKADDDNQHASSWSARRDSLAGPLSAAVAQVNTLTSETNSAEQDAINASNAANQISTTLNTQMSSQTSSLEQSNTYMSNFAAKQAEIYNSYARTDPSNATLANVKSIAASFAKEVTDNSVAASVAASQAYASSVAQSKAISDAAYQASLDSTAASVAAAISDANSTAASVAAENDYNYRNGAHNSYDAIVDSMQASVNADLQNIDGDAIAGEIAGYASAAKQYTNDLAAASSAINDMGKKMEHAVQSEITKSNNAAEPRNPAQL